jgi:hypothetical protein
LVPLIDHLRGIGVRTCCWTTEIKGHAERKAGEMILNECTAGRKASAGDDRKSDFKLKRSSLKDYRISDDQAVRWTALALMPAEHFEPAVATAKGTAGNVTTAFGCGGWLPHCCLCGFSCQSRARLADW